MRASTAILGTAVLLAVLAASSHGMYTANVFVVNLTNKPMTFVNCSTSANGTLPIWPQSIPPGQATRFYVNTTTTWEDVSGFCWWAMQDAPKCDPTPPPAPVTSCPYIGWQRIVVAGEEDIEWDTETPGKYGIGDVSITKVIGHQSIQYCFCTPETSNCQQACRDL